MSIKGEEAIGYVRVSTVRQVEEGNSIQSQIDDLRNYANSRGLILHSKNIVIELCGDHVLAIRIIITHYAIFREGAIQVSRISFSTVRTYYSRRGSIFNPNFPILIISHFIN